jgi:DNA-directed RNA polymerase I, II, and III subunit RPABC2
MPLLECNPSSEIPFTSDMVGEETTTLTLKNVSDSIVAYKVKTTAQKKYLVSPSNGILTAGETVKVPILKQARYVPAEKEDRFMVLSCVTTSTDKLSKEEWTAVTAQKNVEDIRLKIVLKASEMSPIPEKNSNRMDDSRTRDLQAKYDELLNYTLDVERMKKTADTQLEHLTSSTSSKGMKTGYPLYVLLLFMVISAAASRNFDKILGLFEVL